MEERTLVCIGCPLGCRITVKLDGAAVVSVTGNTCKRGEDYARKEVTDPTRIVTGTVPLTGSAFERRLPVKTQSDIPKGKIFACMEAVKAARAQVPVHTGDVIVKNAAGTGVNIVACKTVEE